MPTYEYRCNACKREFEAQQKMADPDLTHCTACHQDKVEKLISWTSVRSNVWQGALTQDNPKEAMKGTHAVDKGMAPRRKSQSTLDDSFKPCGEACARSAEAERAVI